MNTTADEYYTLAKAFCTYIEQTVITKEELDAIMTHLMSLYMKGIALPNVEPDDIDTCRRKRDPSIAKIRIECGETFYWQLFDPYILEDPVGCDVQEDLSEIYDDIMDGIYEYEHGRINNAVWEWTFGLYEHWGRHLVHALSAFHALRKMD